MEQRLEQIHIESANRGRLMVVSRGDPARVAVDQRRRNTVMGGFMGGAAGLALVLSIGLFDHRLRSMRDARDIIGRITILGILPELPDAEDLPDAEQDAVAAHCVHQIRTLLHINTRQRAGVVGGRVYSVTSPGSRDGKTSLAMSLGYSFAATGSRTLLIDFDLVGGGLSHRARPETPTSVADLLRRAGRLDGDQARSFDREAIEQGMPVEELLIEAGHLSREEAEHLAQEVRDRGAGLLGVISGRPMDQCVTHMGQDNLDMLPMGEAEVSHAYRVSPETMRRVLEEARAAYDIVLVDTGPVPGSLEASHAAVEADAVILVASRGIQRGSVAQSITHLESLDAHIAGLVFNRAEGWDVEMAASSSAASRSRSRPSDEDQALGGRPKQTTRVDPIARAVAGSSSVDQKEPV